MNIFTAREIGQLINEHTNKCIYCINDNARIALRCGANAVHLGKEDISVSAAWEMAKEQLFPGETFYIGATANTFEDIEHAVGQGSFLYRPGAFPLYGNEKNSVPFSVWKDTEKIVQQCKEAGYKIPIFAIGGICLEDVTPLMETGITGIAVSGAIIHAEDPVEETRRFINEINKY